MPGELVTANQMNTHIRDNMNAILGGLVDVGFTEIDLLGASAAPAVASSSHATLYYDTVNRSLMVSVSGGAYESIGGAGFLPANVVIISGWSDVVRGH